MLWTQFIHVHNKEKKIKESQNSSSSHSLVVNCNSANFFIQPLENNSV